MYDFAVIGAGVVGGLVARELSRYNFSICILEKENDVGAGTSKANSGIIHAGFDAKEGSLKAKLNVRGAVMMPKIAEELGVHYKMNGSVVIGFNDEDMEQAKELYERGVKNGVEGLKILTGDEMRSLEPNLSDSVVGGLYAPTGGIICPYNLAVASVGNAMDNGADLKTNFKVIKIEKNDTYKIYSENEYVEAKFVINCAGLYSDEIARMCGRDLFKISPRKGEYIILDKECGNLVKHTVFRVPTKAGKGVLVSPTVDGNIILGPTSVEINDKEDLTVTTEGLNKIIKEEFENVKILPLNKSITIFSGNRAACEKGDFVIEMTENEVHTGGIESPGLTSAPAIAEYIIEMLKKTGVEFIENKGFNPIRKPYHYFNELTDDEKNEVIKENPKFGRIVCRCEQISEGEILEAIHRNPPARDLDGVKRRTRSQMGRCQGGFCGPYITEIIAKELEIDATEVTKSGGDSRICIGYTGKGVKKNG